MELSKNKKSKGLHKSEAMILCFKGSNKYYIIIFGVINTTNILSLIGNSFIIAPRNH